MKIICVANNYGQIETENQRPSIYIKPDSTLLKDGRPFFIPSCTGTVGYGVELVVKISRLGKCIAERFAHRYYDMVTVGVGLTALDLFEEAKSQGQPWTISKAFDGSAVIGQWVNLQELTDTKNIPFRLEVDGQPVQGGQSADMLHTVDQVIAYISQFMTLKIGDIIFMGAPVSGGTLAIDQHMTGWLDNQRLLDFKIK
ncbi:MAG TPA: fumarylacetoacetate hydrolase family protein [Bacteroidaceae bacterium]|nr:fumarylacetoacetate hydrolase family protein [Bacteroidaceae bacterium]